MFYKALQVVAGGTLALALMTASACAPVSVRLSDGNLTTLTGTPLGVRDQLDVSPRVPSGALEYRPGTRCRYDRSSTDPGGRQTDINYDVRVDTVFLDSRPTDRLVVTMTSAAGESTALIGRRGHLYDFNSLDELRSTRVNRTNYDEYTASVVEEARRYGPAAHVLNEWSILLADFTDRRWTPGEVAAVITDENGGRWGQFVYRGMLVEEAASRDYAVFDITRTLETAPNLGPVVAGYSILDTSTLMPLQVVLEMGYKLTFHRRSCSS